MLQGSDDHRCRRLIRRVFQNVMCDHQGKSQQLTPELLLADARWAAFMNLRGCLAMYAELNTAICVRQVCVQMLDLCRHAETVASARFRRQSCSRRAPGLTAETH